MKISAFFFYASSEENRSDACIDGDLTSTAITCETRKACFTLLTNLWKVFAIGIPKALLGIDKNTILH